MKERSRLSRRRRALGLLAGALLAGTLTGCSQAPRPGIAARDVFWPSPPDAPRVRFLYAFSDLDDLGVKKPWHRRIGRLLTGSPQVKARLAGPYDVFADGDGTFYVTDTATRSIHCLDRRAGTHREIWRAKDGELLSPIGLAVHGDGRLFVSDSLLGEVLVYDRGGNPLRSIGRGELDRPTGVALDEPRERLCVVDTAAHAVKIFGLEGALLLTVGGRGKSEGSFNYPTCVAVDREGRIFVGDALNFRIQIFDPDGRYLAHFGEAGDGTGYFSQIKGLDLDSEGHIYVTDAQHDVIQVFTRQGDYLLSIGGPGQGPGEFHMPVGVHIDEKDRIYVADRLNRRVQVLQYLPVRDDHE